jgi:hypothetical protein
MWLVLIAYAVVRTNASNRAFWDHDVKDLAI